LKEALKKGKDPTSKPSSEVQSDQNKQVNPHSAENKPVNPPPPPPPASAELTIETAETLIPVN